LDYIGTVGYGFNSRPVPSGAGSSTW
jgi:hypothetical protein